jgi:hypothetical protein
MQIDCFLIEDEAKKRGDGVNWYREEDMDDTVRSVGEF